MEIVIIILLAIVIILLISNKNAGDQQITKPDRRLFQIQKALKKLERTDELDSDVT